MHSLGGRFLNPLDLPMLTSVTPISGVGVVNGQCLRWGNGPPAYRALAFTDHVAFPFLHAFRRVHDPFKQRRVANKVVWIGSGRLGLPDRGLLAMTLGVDMINVGREAMMAAGCIQAQRCPTGHCPIGVATNSKWLQTGLDPTDEGIRVGRFIQTMRFELGRMARACGVDPPSQKHGNQIEIINGMTTGRTAHEFFINRWRGGPLGGSRAE